MSNSGSYRRRPGIGGLPALLVGVLLLALTGCGVGGGTDRSDASLSVDPSATSTAATPSDTPADERPFGPMSIVRSGSGFTLTGQLPDADMKVSLVDAIKQAMPGSGIVDELTVNPDVKGPDFSALGALFGTALDVDGFRSTLVGDTLILVGTAPSIDVKAAATAAAGAAWPNVGISNDIRVEPVSATPSGPAPPAPR